MISSFYPVHRVAQTYDMGCWSAALAMMFNAPMSASPGDASLNEEGGIDMQPENVRRLADSWGLRLLSFVAYGEDGFAQLMAERGPLMICGGMNLQGSSGGVYPHAVVAFAYDGLVHIHDPEPVNVGTTHRMSWTTFMTRFPLGAIYFLSRR